MYVFVRADEQLLVVYYEREQHDQRLVREPRQRQREHERQEQHQLRMASPRRIMMALLTLFNC